MKKLLLSVMLLIGIGGCSKEKTPEIPMPKELITEVHISPITEHYYIDDVLTITAKGFLSGDKILFRNKKDVIATIENLTNSKIALNIPQGIELGRNLMVLIRESKEQIIATLNLIERPIVKNCIEITIPNDFSDGWVKKVMIGEHQVAEICREYLKGNGINNQAIVVYPMTEDGSKVDLQRGVVAKILKTESNGTVLPTLTPENGNIHGGSLSWDMENNTLRYTKGSSSALSSVYLQEGVVVSTPSNIEDCEVVVQPDILVDNRISEVNSYKIVKIGTQYWLAENFRATAYVDGTPIPFCQIDWPVNQSSAYCWYDGVGEFAGSNEQRFSVKNADESVKRTYGALYNWHATFHPKFATAGWRVPTQSALNAEKTSDFDKLVAYIGNSGVSLKRDKTSLHFDENNVETDCMNSQDDYVTGTWAKWNNKLNCNGTNISGFDAVPCGGRNESGKFFEIGTHCIYWTSSTSIDSDGEWARLVVHYSLFCHISFTVKNTGISVRLIRK